MMKAQNETDVARFMHFDFGGTARFNAMGGAMGALGGDVSTLMTNPAGMGIYRSSEFTLSPTFVPMTGLADFYGNSSSQSELNFNLNNFGYVRAFEMNDKGKWKYLQFGLSYVPLKNLNADYTIRGQHNDGSLSQEIAADAFGILSDDLEGQDPFYIFPAYDTFLIDPDSTTSALDYVSAIPVGTQIDQETRLNRRGRVSETVFAGSANYNDKLYLGFGIGYNKVVFDEYMDYQETVLDTGVTDLISFSMIQDVEMRGSGINIKLGAIYRVSDLLRIGGAYTSPTWNFMNTSWNTSISTYFNDGQRYTRNAPALGSNDYYMTTPARMMASIGFVLGKRGLFDVDYEYVDYAGGKLGSYRPTPIDFSASNSALRSNMRSVGNLRAGLELRHEQWSLRGGYAYYPDPYQEGKISMDANKTIISGGLGYRKDQVNVDLGIRNTRFGTDYQSYAPDKLQVAQLDESQTAIILTFGLKF